MYIRRSLHGRIEELFSGQEREGLILAGIVGSGKTTLVCEVLNGIKTRYATFSFTGDDVIFREAVARDTKWIHEQIRSKTQEPALVFVDEIQKSANIFDAIKYAFDEGEISFIVSGSNPHYLKTTARKRLQRRGKYLTLAPLSLPEVLEQDGLVPRGLGQVFSNYIATQKVELPRDIKLTLASELNSVVGTYLAYGGLPLAHKKTSPVKKLQEIQQVVERGFEAISNDTDDITDLVRVELARIHSRELTYRGIMNQTGVRKRDVINQVIEGLINHGYLLKKKPLLFEPDRRSYLSVFAYSDPGIVSYLTGDTTLDDRKGQIVEGIVHSQLEQLLQLIPLKTKLSYFKPYTIDANSKVKYLDGEIDFVITQGRVHIPLEVKSSNSSDGIDTHFVQDFIIKRKSPFGVILYGGVPQWRKAEKLLYWPYWLI